MPFKLHSKCRRHIPQQRHRVTNWREYDASLRNRGSLIIWFTVRQAKLACSSRWKSGSGKAIAGRPIASVARALATTTVKRTQQSGGVCIELRNK